MKFGLFLANQHPPGTDLVAALREQIRLLHAARDGGWDGVFVGHHYLADGIAMLQPVPFLGRLAAESGDMELGLGILLLPLLNPVHVAETVASLDVITDGRLILGIGLGYRTEEADAFTIPRGDLAYRFEANLDAVRRLCTEDDVMIDLPWCQVNGATLTIKPTSGMPPVWMAGHADAAVRRAARSADAWFVNPHASLEAVRGQLELFHTERTASDLAPAATVPIMREIFCASTRELALDTAGPHLSAKYASYARWGQDSVLPERQPFTAGLEELAHDRFIVGTPEDCVEQLVRWREIGGNYFVLRTHWPGLPVDAAISSVDLLNREVIPNLVR